MRYAIRTILFEKRRYMAGVLAVAFSALLIAMQVGILIGLIGVVSVPIVNSAADVWVAYPDTPACDLGRPLPAYWIDRLWAHPEVQSADEFIQGFRYWQTDSGKNELIVVLGVNLRDDSLGPIRQLTAEQRALLTEPGAVVLDRKDAGRLGVTQCGETGEVGGMTVRVVGFAPNMRAVTGPYVLCSLSTARRMLGMREDQATYLLARCRDKGRVDDVVEDLRASDVWSAYESQEFQNRSELHWIAKTKAGVALGFAAVLGLAVGCSITSQTLYSAIGASLRELAVLRALGIPRWRMILFVFQQALAVGVAGLLIAAPATYALLHLVRSLGTQAVMPMWLASMTAGLTLGMSLLAGLAALRSLRGVEPAQLLR